MVEEIKAFKTKYGTLIENKQDAEKVEKLETKDNFAEEFANMCIDINDKCNLSLLGKYQLEQVGELIYLYPSSFFKLMEKYSLIMRLNKEWIPADNKEE